MALSTPAAGDVRWVSYRDVRPDGAPITFSEVRLGTVAPSYTVGKNRVHFGSTFVGQSAGNDPNLLDDASPDRPLRLAPDRAAVATAIDLAHGSVVLGGQQRAGTGRSYFTTPIAILFEQAVQAVGFRVGALDAPAVLTVEAYDHAGNSLGRLSNPEAGIASLALASYGAKIAGVSLYLTSGMDWEGFGIDDVVSETGTGGEVPEPASWMVWLGIALGGMWFCAALQRQSSPPAVALASSHQPSRSTDARGH